jgi:hypothetical protein
MGILLLIYSSLFTPTFSRAQLGSKINGLVYLEVSRNISLQTIVHLLSAVVSGAHI